MVYVRINVHLDDTIFDSKLDFIVGGTRSSVHNKEDGLGIVGSKLFLGIFLVLSKTSRLKGNISRLVDTMNISKGGSNGEHGPNLGKPLIDGPDLFRTGVELFGVNWNFGKRERKQKEGLEKETQNINFKIFQLRRNNSPSSLLTPSSSPPVIPISISNQIFILARRSKY